MNKNIHAKKDTYMEKHIFIEIQNIKNKLKKIQKYIVSNNVNNYIIHEYGKYKITGNTIIDDSNIPKKCYKKTINLNMDNTSVDNTSVGVNVDIFVNMYEKNTNHKRIYIIPINNKVIKTERTTYKLNSKSTLSFIFEKNIMFDNTNDIYDVDFLDEENNIIIDYYFKLEDESEDSYFIKEDISAFLECLN